MESTKELAWRWSGSVRKQGRPPVADESPVVVRAIAVADQPAWVRMRCELWPGDEGDHDSEATAYFAGAAREPRIVLVAVRDRALLGFAEVSLRAYAEGCRSSPVGYLEGWFVRPESRGQGVGRLLVEAAEDWSKAHGCTEFGSDADAGNAVSAAAHVALGFEEVAVVRQFRKSL